MITKEIVLAHDSFTLRGGAERVFEAFTELFPEAAIYTMVSEKRSLGNLSPARIHTTFLQSFYNFIPKLKLYLFLLPIAIKLIKLPDTKIILSSSSLFLKALRKPNGTKHIQYCHTPPRFLWTDPEYINQEVPWLFRPFVKLLFKGFRNWDREQAQSVDIFIANSLEVKKRIKHFYNRESFVVYPFVDTDFWKPLSHAKEDFFLMGGRLQAHKNYDFAIEAFRDTNLKLVVLGEGRQAEILKKSAPENVKFLGPVSDEELRNLYSRAQGFIFPPVEDAGIMPLEAAACGAATLALRKAGSLETVVEGETGEFFDSLNSDIIRAKLLAWNAEKYLLPRLLAHAEKFNKQRFVKEILSIVNEYSN